MAQRLDDREVRVGQADVLPHHGDGHRALAAGGIVEELAQVPQVGPVRRQAQAVQDHGVEPLLVQGHGHLVDGGGIHAGQHLLGAHVAEQGYLFAHGIGQLVVRPAHDEVGLHAQAAQLLHRVLGGLGLHLVGSSDVGHQRHMGKQHLARGLLLLELPRRLDERQALDVTDGAADLGYDDVGAGLIGYAAQALLYGLGHMRDDLHRPSEEVAATLASDEGLVDGALGEVGFASKVLVDEALIMAEVQVAFVAILGDEHLAMLKRAHGARVHVEVGVHLLHGHLVSAGFQQMPQRCRGDALAQRRHHAAGDEDVLCHGSRSFRSDD